MEFLSVNVEWEFSYLNTATKSKFAKDSDQAIYKQQIYTQCF